MSKEYCKQCKGLFNHSKCHGAKLNGMNFDFCVICAGKRFAVSGRLRKKCKQHPYYNLYHAKMM